MNFQQTSYNFLIADNSKRIARNANIKSATVFHAILAKERARVDRNSHVFSLVSFEVGTQDSDIESIDNLICQLKKQIRITDEIGWLDNDLIGVLLFNSLNEEAKFFIEKIKRNCFSNILCKCSISTYPEDKVDHSHNEGCHTELGNFSHHYLSGSTSLADHDRATDEQVGLRL